MDILLEGGVTAISTIMDDNSCSFTECCKVHPSILSVGRDLPGQGDHRHPFRDIERAKAEGKLAVIMSTQGASASSRTLRYISLLNRLGLKIVQLTYNQQCHIGSGAFEGNDTGLTRFGQQCIYEMNRVGMLIDLSHVGRRTSLDAIATSSDPVIFSHSSCYDVAKTPATPTTSRSKRWRRPRAADLPVSPQRHVQRGPEHLAHRGPVHRPHRPRGGSGGH